MHQGCKPLQQCGNPTLLTQKLCRATLSSVHYGKLVQFSNLQLGPHSPHCFTPSHISSCVRPVLAKVLAKLICFQKPKTWEEVFWYGIVRHNLCVSFFIWLLCNQLCLLDASCFAPGLTVASLGNVSPFANIKNINPLLNPGSPGWVSVSVSPQSIVIRDNADLCSYVSLDPGQWQCWYKFAANISELDELAGNITEFVANICELSELGG